MLSAYHLTLQLPEAVFKLALPKITLLTHASFEILFLSICIFIGIDFFSYLCQKDTKENDGITYVSTIDEKTRKLRSGGKW